MAQKSKKKIVSAPRSVAIAERGITTSRECAAFLSALITDVMGRKIPFGQASVALVAVHRLLTVVELQQRYSPHSVLALTEAQTPTAAIGSAGKVQTSARDR